MLRRSILYVFAYETTFSLSLGASANFRRSSTSPASNPIQSCCCRLCQAFWYIYITSLCPGRSERLKGACMRVSLRAKYMDGTGPLCDLATHLSSPRPLALPRRSFYCWCLKPVTKIGTKPPRNGFERTKIKSNTAKLDQIVIVRCLTRMATC